MKDISSIVNGKIDSKLGDEVFKISLKTIISKLNQAHMSSQVIISAHEIDRASKTSKTSL